jgi:hypothetical protein
LALLCRVYDMGNSHMDLFPVSGRIHSVLSHSEHIPWCIVGKLLSGPVIKPDIIGHHFTAGL